MRIIQNNVSKYGMYNELVLQPTPFQCAFALVFHYFQNNYLLLFLLFLYVYLFFKLTAVN